MTFFRWLYVYCCTHSAVWNNSPSFENCNAIFKRGTIIALQIPKGAIISCNFQKGGLLFHCKSQKGAIIKGGLLFHAIFKRGATIVFPLQFSKEGLLFHASFKRGNIIPWNFPKGDYYSMQW